MLKKVITINYNMGSHYFTPFDFRPVYATKDFWHGSGEIGTGAKKVLVKLYLHYNVFTVPKIPCQNFWPPWRHAQFRYKQRWTTKPSCCIS